MNILITGGTGFIGSFFAHKLHEQGHTLIVYDLREVAENNPLPAHTFVKGDVRDAELLKAVANGCDHILHLAAAHHDFGIERKTFFDVNETGMQNVCDAADAAGIKAITFYSTVATFGDAPEPHDEDAPTDPVSDYGQSKLAGEVVLKAWAEGAPTEKTALVVRPTVTFGPRNFANMYSLIRQVDSGKFFQVGKGDNIKSLSYVENIVDATLFLNGLAKGKEGGDGPATTPGFHLYNWIDKPDLTSAEITAEVYKSLGKKPPKVSVPMWAALLMATPFDVVIKTTGKNLPVSSARIRKLFAMRTKFESDKIHATGFEARYTIAEGIQRMVDWYNRTGKSEEAVWRLPPAEPVIHPNPQEAAAVAHQAMSSGNHVETHASV